MAASAAASRSKAIEGRIARRLAQLRGARGWSLEALAERTAALPGAPRISLDVDLDYEAGRSQDRHDPELETAVYRIVQEAVTNAVKHAGAEEVDVEVRESGGAVEVSVRDAGRGFEPEGSTAGFGLVGMRERVESLGGTLAVQSAPGAGTTVTARLPTGQAAGEETAAPSTVATRSAASSSRM